MKAMAARPAAPKEATSLAPAPVNGLTGLDGVAEALVDEALLEADDQVPQVAAEVVEEALLLVLALAVEDQPFHPWDEAVVEALLEVVVALAEVVEDQLFHP